MKLAIKSLDRINTTKRTDNMIDNDFVFLYWKKHRIYASEHINEDEWIEKATNNNNIGRMYLWVVFFNKITAITPNAIAKPCLSMEKFKR